MSFTKFARAEILDFKWSSGNQRTASLAKYADADYDDYRTDQGYLYVRVRAISSRVNRNNDGWPSQELKKSYATFMHRPSFVDHHNHDPQRARGVVVDAKLHVEDDPKTAGLDPYYSSAPEAHKPPTWVELLIEVDAKSFPKLAKAIVDGDIDGVSMGANVERSKCSHCNNWARTPEEYCQHVRSKGAMFDVWENGKKTAKKSYEDCYDINFFEISFVFDPADETALIREVRSAVQKEGALMPGIDPMLYRLAREAWMSAYTRQPSGRSGDRDYAAWMAANHALDQAGVPGDKIHAILQQLDADQAALEDEVALRPNDEGAMIEDYANIPHASPEVQHMLDRGHMAVGKCASCQSDLEDGECVIHGVQKTADKWDGPKDENGIPKAAHYRESDSDTKCCSTCSYFKNGNCSMWKAKVGAEMLCDEWEGNGKESSFTKEAPGNEHMKGVSPKRNRQYEHIKDSLLESGKSEDEAKEEAARTVNKQRAEHGETKEGREFSEERREKDAENGDAESDGSYPIENKEDLKNAEEAFGRSKDKAKTKRHIDERAKELGEPPMGSDKESRRVADTREEPQSMKQIAPEKVDTLRQETTCPICGSTMEDGSCEVCDFTEPPEGFGNPDLTKAQGTDDQQDAMGMDAENAQDASMMQEGIQGGPQMSQAPQGMPMAASVGATDPSTGSVQPLGHPHTHSTTKPLQTNSVTTEKLAADLSGGRVNTQERPLLPATRPTSDRPKNQKTLSDSGKPVESTRKTDENMAQRTAENGAQPNGDLSADPMATQSVEQVGGVVLDPESSEKTVDPTGIGGVDPVNKPESVAVDGAVADAVGPHTDTWQNGEGDSAGQHAPVTRDKMSSEKISLEILPESVKPEDTVDLEAGLKEEVGPPTETFGSDDFHITDPVTTEAFPPAEDVKRMTKVQMLAALRVVKAEIELGLTPENEEIERITELEDEPLDVLNAQLETLSRVRSAGVRTASRKVAARTGFRPGLQSGTPVLQKSASAGATDETGYVEGIFT